MLTVLIYLSNYIECVDKLPEVTINNAVYSLAVYGNENGQKWLEVDQHNLYPIIK